MISSNGLVARVLCAFSASLLLAACSGSDNDAGQAQPTATATTAVTETFTSSPLPTATATASSSATPTATATLRPTLSFNARGSVGQVYVTEAEPGSSLSLMGPDGSLVTSAAADEQGSLIFREVEPGEGYLVMNGSAPEPEVSEPLTVMAPDEHPDASFYESQVIGPGYGYLETRDGTLLATNIILPGPVSAGPFPTVIEYSGYDPANPDEPEPSSLIANALGYAVVGVNMRGTGCSGGAFQFFEPLQWTDGYDAVEIIAAQEWVKGGKVGMVGISYPGISQLFVAQLRPPHLVAVAPLSVIADTFRGTLYPGGILNNGFAVDWAADRQHDAMAGGQPWSRKRMDAGDEVCIANQKLRAQAPDIFDMIEQNQFYHPEVADPVAPVTFVDKIDVPVFLAGSWQDEQVGGYFATMLDRFATDKLFVTLVNGGHAEPLIPTIFTRWFEFLALYVAEDIPRRTGVENLVMQVIGREAFNVNGLHLDVPDRFADAQSYSEALALYETDPRVRVLFDNGAGGAPGVPLHTFELTFDSWPVRNAEARAWYFGANGTLVPEPAAEPGIDSFLYDTSKSQLTTYEGGDIGLWGPLPSWNWPPLESGKAVAYVSEPLAQDLIVAGSGSVDLWLSASAPDVDLQVTLSEVRPDGQEMYVQGGWLRASHRKIDEVVSTAVRPYQTHLEEDAALLPSAEFTEARVEIFPFAHAFRAGSRLRISVEAPGASRPRWKFDVLPGEVMVSIARSAARPSRLVLPVVPEAEIPTPLPPCPSLRAQPCRPYVALDNAS
jgi:hypothetical protein